MTHRANAEGSGWSAEELWRWVYRGTVTIVALVLTVAGLVAILAASLWVTDGAWHHVLRDMGIAVLVSGLVSTAYEYVLRYSFTQEAKTHLRELLKERYEELDLLHEAGVKAIHTKLPTHKVADGFQYARHIRILQTWTGDFAVTDDIGSAINEAAKNNKVDIKILLLNPSSAGVLSRETDLGRDDIANCVRKDLGDLKFLCNKDESINRKIQVRLYNATPVMAIHGYDDTNIVGFYWQDQVSQWGTQFELNSELGEQEVNHKRSAGGNLHFSRAVDKHFIELWDSPTKSVDAKESSEWKKIGIP